MAERLQVLEDEADRIRNRLIEISQNDERLQRNGYIDPQEEADRLEATQAYLGESEQHFVDYVEESVRTSAEANREVREIQQESWRVYQEDPPPNYALKEDWQSKVVIPKPHGAVQFAMAAVDQAFKPNFLTIEDRRDPKLAQFWRRLFEIQYNRQHAKFVKRFTIASGMGFATGQSFEFIPVWRPGRGLDFSLAEPWKIHRDPDALSQEPQTGLYWVHEEWQDTWYLQDMERRGKYQNTADLRNTTQHQEQNPQNFQMDRHLMADLRTQIWNRNKYRTSILTREFWGTVLDKRGNLLHPGLTFTTGGNRVISAPRPSPYRTLRWPGISYSPLPNFLRFEGRSLLQSVRSLWYFMCNLQALHIDYLNWIVNPMREINQNALVDQDDIDPYPGKVYLTRGTLNGQQAIRTVDHRFNTSEVLANKQAADQDFQRGTFITDPIQGLPGYRQQITARESAQNLQQSLTVFSIVGQNLDIGAVDITQAAMETIILQITRDELLSMFDRQDLIDVFGESADEVMLTLFPGIPMPAIFVPTPDEYLRVYGEIPEGLPLSFTGVELPPTNGTFRITGLQALLKDFQRMRAIRDVIIPMTENPLFQPFLRPHKIAKVIEASSNLMDEDMLVSEEEAEQIDMQQRESQAQLQQMQMQAFERQQQLEEARMQLEVRKSEMEEQKLMLEAQKAQLEAEQAQLEAERQQAELAGEMELKRVEIESKQADLAKVAAEVAKSEHELFADIMKTELDLRKNQAQIDKIVSQIELQERKAQAQERLIKAQIQAAKQRPQQEGGNDGR